MNLTNITDFSYKYCLTAGKKEMIIHKGYFADNHANQELNNSYVLLFSIILLRGIDSQFLAFLLPKAAKGSKNAFCGCACLCDPYTTCGLNKK
jgi:hypothetical protein